MSHGLAQNSRDVFISLLASIPSIGLRYFSLSWTKKSTHRYESPGEKNINQWWQQQLSKTDISRSSWLADPHNWVDDHPPPSLKHGKRLSVWDASSHQLPGSGKRPGGRPWEKDRLSWWGFPHVNVWLVVFSHPSEKYECVNWEDDIHPIFMGK